MRLWSPSRRQDRTGKRPHRPPPPPDADDPLRLTQSDELRVDVFVASVQEVGELAASQRPVLREHRQDPGAHGYVGRTVSGGGHSGDQYVRFSGPT